MGLSCLLWYKTDDPVVDRSCLFATDDDTLCSTTRDQVVCEKLKNCCYNPLTMQCIAALFKENEGKYNIMI